MSSRCVKEEKQTHETYLSRTGAWTHRLLCRSCDRHGSGCCRAPSGWEWRHGTRKQSGLAASSLALMGFLLGIGAMSDRITWTRGGDTPLRHGPPEGKPAWTRDYLASITTTRSIAVSSNGVTGFILPLVGGSFALVFRTELADTGISFLQAGTLQHLPQYAWLGGVGRHSARHRWPGELPGPAHDRRRGHGLPAAARVCLLDQRARRHHASSAACFSAGIGVGLPTRR